MHRSRTCECFEMDDHSFRLGDHGRYTAPNFRLDNILSKELLNEKETPTKPSFYYCSVAILAS